MNIITVGRRCQELSSGLWSSCRRWCSVGVSSQHVAWYKKEATTFAASDAGMILHGHTRTPHTTTSSLLMLLEPTDGLTHFFSVDQYPPLVVNLNHALSNASLNLDGSAAKLFTMSRYAGSCRRERSLVSLMTPAKGPVAPWIRHCHFPPGQ